MTRYRLPSSVAFAQLGAHTRPLSAHRRAAFSRALQFVDSEPPPPPARFPPPARNCTALALRCVSVRVRKKRTQCGEGWAADGRYRRRGRAADGAHGAAAVADRHPRVQPAPAGRRVASAPAPCARVPVLTTDLSHMTTVKSHRDLSED
ncbi:hypothetical protein EVAR_14828_1 [Eumeta japonica]|uniref:Uncharacterized protein n=1 Tax=Eumeta variegata TaxID=151549 RepID=A0A4C1V4F0_EUMVA|nr:hypothetical protein EVAR_14828_1 [Eumeta japonica]